MIKHKLDRREFMKIAAMGAGACAAPLGFGCGQGPASEEPLVLAQTGPTLKGGMPHSLFSASREEVDLELQVISGALPTDLQGHVFVVAAIPWGDGSMIFNGDGIMYRLDLGDQPKLTSRVAKSPCYWADQAARDTPLGFKNVGVTRLGPMGIRNELNTAFMPMGDRLLVTYDGGRPWEVDVNTLELVAPMGTHEQWRDSLPFLNAAFPAYLSTAHPYWDEHTQEVISVNYGPTVGPEDPGFTNVMVWDTEGDVVSWSLKDEQGQPIIIEQSIHQLAVTRDYILVVDCAFLTETEQFGNPDYARAQSPDTVLYIVERSALKAGTQEVLGRKLVMPRESVHLSADYDNPDGRVTLYIAHNTASDASEWLRKDDVLYKTGEPVEEVLHGVVPMGTDINFIGRHVIDAREATLIDSTLLSNDTYTWGLAFQTHHGQTPGAKLDHVFFNSIGLSDQTLTRRIVELYESYPHRKVALKDLPKNKPSSLFHYDTKAADIVDAYAFPAGRAGSSPQFVPRVNASSGQDGYIVCTVVSDDTSWKNSSGDEFWIFDAQNIAQGPLVRLGHTGLSMGFTLHTTYLERIAPRTASYEVDVRQDYASLLADQSEDVKELFEQSVFPHFE